MKMEAKTAQMKVTEVKHMTEARVGENKIIDAIADILTKGKTEADKEARTMLGVDDKYDFKDDPSMVTDKEKYDQAMAKKAMAGYVILAGIKSKSPEWKKALTDPTIDKIHDLIPSVYFGLEKEILAYAQAGEGLEHVALKNRAYGEGSLLTSSQKADKSAETYLQDLKEKGYAAATMQGLDKKTAKKAEKAVAKEVAKTLENQKSEADKWEVKGTLNGRVVLTRGNEIKNISAKEFGIKYPEVDIGQIGPIGPIETIEPVEPADAEAMAGKVELYSVKDKGGGFEVIDFNPKKNTVQVKGPDGRMQWVKFEDVGPDKGEMRHYDAGGVIVMEHGRANGEYTVTGYDFDMGIVVVGKPFGGEGQMQGREIPMAEFNKSNPGYWERMGIKEIPNSKSQETNPPKADQPLADKSQDPKTKSQTGEQKQNAGSEETDSNLPEEFDEFFKSGNKRQMEIVAEKKAKGQEDLSPLLLEYKYIDPYNEDIKDIMITTGCTREQAIEDLLKDRYITPDLARVLMGDQAQETQGGEEENSTAREIIDAFNKLIKTGEGLDDKILKEKYGCKHVKLEGKDKLVTTMLLTDYWLLESNGEKFVIPTPSLLMPEKYGGVYKMNDFQDRLNITTDNFVELKSLTQIDNDGNIIKKGEILTKPNAENEKRWKSTYTNEEKKTAEVTKPKEKNVLYKLPRINVTVVTSDNEVHDEYFTYGYLTNGNIIVEEKEVNGQAIRLSLPRKLFDKTNPNFFNKWKDEIAKFNQKR